MLDEEENFLQKSFYYGQISLYPNLKVLAMLKPYSSGWAAGQTHGHVAGGIENCLQELSLATTKVCYISFLELMII